MENTTSPYRISSANSDNHLMAIAKMASDQYANGEYVEEIAQTYFDNCHYDWGTTRLIWDKKHLIHHWGVWGYSMRLESVLLQVASVGAVVTLEPYRKRGLMQQAALASFESMYQQGYDLSILRGRHYVKFGYARAWNYITYRLKSDEIPDLPIKHPYQKLDTEHIQAMDSVYNQTHQSFNGTAVRPTYRNKDSDGITAYGWFNEIGELAGYVRAAAPDDDKKTWQCLEAAGDPQQALAVLNELFKQGEYESLTFFTLPPQHPLLQFIRTRDCIVETKYFSNSGWRVRIVNLHSTLEKIRSLLETRLQHSQFANWKGKLLLDAGKQHSVLDIANGIIQVVEAQSTEHCVHGGAGIGRLVIGSDEPVEVIRQEKITCTGDALQLTTVLFPNLYPLLSHWDEC